MSRKSEDIRAPSPNAVKDLIASEPANNPLIRPIGHLLPLSRGRRDCDKAAENMIINP